MQPRQKTGFAILVALFAVGFLGLALWPKDREPSSQGKPLRVWLKGFDASQQSSEYAEAESAIRNMGTNALPWLIRYLRHKDPPFFESWIRLKSALHLVHGEVNYACFWHRRAAHACGALGAAAEEAFPALSEAMNDRAAASDVGNGLSRMMPRSVPVLTNILATGNVTARSRAADNLVTAFSHPEAEPMARTALIAALRDPDAGVRMAAASAFGFWNVHLDEVVPALTRLLRDPSPSVRGNAATTLGGFGSAARPAIPELLALKTDTNAYVGRTVAERVTQMLSKITP
jgi:hypothetical protein